MYPHDILKKGDDMKILGMIILLVFYSIYFGKMWIQKRKGIQTNQIAKRENKDQQYYIELTMKVVTWGVVFVEVISIFSVNPNVSQIMNFTGIILGILGNIIFACAITTMKDSWRAGLAENDRTEMLTSGIYQISRNPAFLGFNCVYLGILFMFFNIPLLIITVLAILMLHIQILQEEHYLDKEYGIDYRFYKKQVYRYLGRKQKNL
ncbi:MAG: isoprenylcysteine carboxylmethyltransferase family protein [Coprobacillus sp.]|nr:isoprenylcysteine carboxylmethyltransferase family protein [Coprobacillus sp.]